MVYGPTCQCAINNRIQKINIGHYFNFFTIIGMKKHVVLSIYRLKMCLCSAPGHRDILFNQSDFNQHISVCEKFKPPDNVFRDNVTEK